MTEDLAPVLVSSHLGTPSFLFKGPYIGSIKEIWFFTPIIKNSDLTETILDLTLSPGEAVSSTSISKIYVFQEHVPFLFARQWRGARILNDYSFISLATSQS